MKCQKMEVQLSCYLDGELPEEQARMVAQHLEECSSCAAEYRTLKKNQMVLSSLVRKEVPETLWPAIQQRVARRDVASLPRSRSAWRVVARGLAAAACLMVLLFFGIVAVGYFSYQSEPPAVAEVPTVTTRDFIKGHATFLADDNPMADRATWAYVQSRHVLQTVIDEENQVP